MLSFCIELNVLSVESHLNRADTCIRQTYLSPSSHFMDFPYTPHKSIRYIVLQGDVIGTYYISFVCTSVARVTIECVFVRYAHSSQVVLPCLQYKIRVIFVYIDSHICFIFHVVLSSVLCIL